MQMLSFFTVIRKIEIFSSKPSFYKICDDIIPKYCEWTMKAVKLQRENNKNMKIFTSVVTLLSPV